MKTTYQIIPLLLIVGLITVTGCKKKEANTKTTAARSFNDLIFNPDEAYFSTDGSMSAPVDSNQAKSMSGKIDLTFIFDYDYTKPGFFDPVARSKEWYWDQYRNTWLSNAIETRFYTTALTESDFNAAKSDQSKIATYFSSSSTVIAPHAIFPEGSCIGGRESSAGPTSLSRGEVFAFKQTVSGKRGLIYIRTDQSSQWPIPLFNTDTRVDIIIEK